MTISRNLSILAEGANATGVLAPTNGGTGVANNTASTLAISGAFGTTLTVTGTTAITLPTSGTLSIVGPTFSAYVSSGQSITGGVATKIQYQTKEWDTASCYDNATNYRFTPTVAGYYQINASFNTNAAVSTAYAMIYKNGSIYRYGTYIPSPQNGPIVTVSSIVYCNGSTDYIEIYGNTSVTGTTNTGTSNNYFTAAMIRGA